MDPLALPFDQYQRYRLVADLIGRIRAARGTDELVVLDVGGRTANLRAFLPDTRVELVDVEVSGEPGLVLGDGSRLPFQDGALDVVCAFDTLEHVPPARREAFVAECARVSRGHVLIAGPYAAPPVDEAEELLQAFLRDKLKEEHRYLEEHRTHGLPDRAATEAGLAAAGLAVESHGHGNLDRWLVLMCMELYMDHDPLLRPLAERFFRFYNERLYASDHAGPVYRHVVVGTRQGLAAPEVQGLLAPPVAPDGALRAVFSLGEELVAFDREQDLWRPEIERLTGVISDLTEDLAGHQARLATQGEDLDAHKGSVADLERDLADQRRTYDTYVGETEALRAELTADRDAAVAATRALEERLRGLEADLEQSVSGAAAQSAEFAQVQTDLLSQVRGLEGHAGNLERELGEQAAAYQQTVSELSAEVEARGAELERLRAALAAGEAREAEAARVAQEREQRLGEAGNALEEARRLLRSRGHAARRLFGPKRDTP